MTLAQALRDIEARKAERDAAIAATKAAREALRAAEFAEAAAFKAVREAETAASVIRGRAWLAKHPDDVATVREGKDTRRLGQLKLGRHRVSSGWRHETYFEFNQLGEDVRAALRAESQTTQEPR